MVDIIITTYNRPAKVLELLNQLIPIVKTSGKIIVVDSSDVPNSELRQQEKLVYIRSSHKNQPYQRYLGYMASKSEFLVFLDDDMELVDNILLTKLEEIFEDKTIAGVAFHFENKHEDSLLAQMPKSNLFKKAGFVKRVKGWLTGYPELKTGKFGLCGNRGKQPKGGGPTEWVSGGAFAARRAVLFQNFNFQLFDIYEEKLGKGEDAIIGYGLSKQGKLIYHEELFFLHNDQRDSTYTMDKGKFSQRVVFSRLFLSTERTRLNCGNRMAALIHYHYYTLWRITGMLVNSLLSPDRERYLMLKGGIKGWGKAMIFKNKLLEETKTFWSNEALTDLKSQHYLSNLSKNIGS